MSVEWRDIPGLIGYQASDAGGIRTRWTKGLAWRPPMLTDDQWRDVRLSRSRGYFQFYTTAGSSSEGWQMVRVHRAVCLAFHGQPQPGEECCHGDGNRANNAASNLRWGTPLDNHQDAVRHGTAPKGERHGSAKLTAEQVREIRRLRRQLPHEEIASRFGVTLRTITSIVCRENWGWLPDDAEPQGAPT